MGIFGKKKYPTPIEEKIGYRFKDRTLLTRALTHVSYVNQYGSGKRIQSNERLEFLGDAVLGLVMAEHLIKEFPGSAEGELTEMRRILVGGDFIAMKGEKLGLGDYLLLSNGEQITGGKSKPSIMADTYEALLGAIYLDGGIKAVREVLKKYHLKDRDKQLKNEEYINYKGELLEYCQARGKRPVYRVVYEEGPDHDKIFGVKVYIGEEELGYGEGTSKKNAEQEAAKATMTSLRKSKT